MPRLYQKIDTLYTREQKSGSVVVVAAVFRTSHILIEKRSWLVRSASLLSSILITPACTIPSLLYTYVVGIIRVLGIHRRDMPACCP